MDRCFEPSISTGEAGGTSVISGEAARRERVARKRNGK